MRGLEEASVLGRGRKEAFSSKACELQGETFPFDIFLQKSLAILVLEELLCFLTSARFLPLPGGVASEQQREAGR